MPYRNNMCVLIEKIFHLGPSALMQIASQTGISWQLLGILPVSCQLCRKGAWKTCK